MGCTSVDHARAYGGSLMQYDPYCGPAPDPALLWQSWNLDPFLLLAALLVAAACSLSSVSLRDGLKSPWAALGWAALIIAFVSPLCALTTALYSARIAHHVLLIAVAAPLLAMAFPAGAVIRRLPLSVLFLLHTVLMWVWHAPAPYALALSSDATYWLMEASLFVSALALWQAILAPSLHPGRALAALLGSIIQMGMLGALFTFAREPLFEAHLTTTLPFGMTPLTDQQLAGILLWVPAAAPYLIAALVIALRLMPASSRNEAA